MSSPNNLSPPRNSCKLLIAKPLDHYFGLMNWYSVYTTDEDVLMAKLFPSTDVWFRDHIHQLVERCSAIEKLEIEFNNSVQIKKWLRAFPFRFHVHVLSIKRLPRIDQESAETILKFLATHSVEHVVFGHISTYFWTDGKCKSALALSYLFDKVVDVAALNIVDCHKLHFFNLSDLQTFWGIKLGDLMKSAKSQFLYHTSQRNNEFVFDSIEVLRKVE